MNWRTECAVVIPCLNEAAGIQPLIREILDHVATVILIDDGSIDRSAELAAAVGAIVLKQGENLGKGAALRRGLTEAHNRGFSWVLTMDGDGQHAPDDIPAFFQGAEINKGSALIVGNRMGNSGMPLVRGFVNRWMSARLSKLGGTPLPDTQCGFRLISLQACRGLTFRANFYEFESELLMEMLRAGLEVRFVPVQTIYRAEKSRIHPWHDTIRWIRWWRNVRGKKFDAPIPAESGPLAAEDLKAPLGNPRLT